MGFTLRDIVPWGRNLGEYRRFFGLTNNDLNKKILACADGPASFNAELTAQGGSCISIDPVYTFSAKQIKSRIDEATQSVFEQLRNRIDYRIEKIKYEFQKGGNKQLRIFQS